jgi:hypothetical protein
MERLLPEIVIVGPARWVGGPKRCALRKGRSSAKGRWYGLSSHSCGEFVVDDQSVCLRIGLRDGGLRDAGLRDGACVMGPA